MKYKTIRDLKRLKIAVLCGGVSSEKDISLKTGKAVFKAIKSLGLNAKLVRMHRFLPSSILKKRFDVVFLALHGRGGEDGKVQAILELLGVAYTGSGVLASALGINKVFSKKIFQFHNIPTPSYVVINKKEGILLNKVKLPVVVKPASEGSTIGVSIVNKKNALFSALKKAFRFDSTVIIEKYIKGRELTVGILNDKALPVMEIVPKRRFYDYTAKYKPGMSVHKVPAEIPKRCFKEAQRLALLAHRSLGCKGATRVDMILSFYGKIYVLEVNTIPGMTETSLLPESAKFCGIEFNQLVLEILKESLERN